MSTTPAPHPQPVVPVPAPDREVRIYSHSALFYWWPMWACCAILGVATMIDGGRMIIVPAPPHSKVANNATVTYKDGPKTITETYPEAVLISETKAGKDPNVDTSLRGMARNKNLGVVFAAVLLATVVVTSVPMRGLWSVLLILFVVLVIVILALANIWPTVAEIISRLDIRISEGGYFFLAAVLFILWALAVFVFDKRTYLIVTSGQVRLCTAIGAGETVYDTSGLTFQKRQDDLFRHWIIGMGSGDLVIHRTNVNQEIDFPNVLFIGGKVREIEKLFKEREVV